MHWQEISTQGTEAGTRRKGSWSSAFHGYSAKEQHPVEDSKTDFSGCWAMEKNTAYLVLYLSDYLINQAIENKGKFKAVLLIFWEKGNLGRDSIKY